MKSFLKSCSIIFVLAVLALIAGYFPPEAQAGGDVPDPNPASHQRVRGEYP
jgi:hypothetical protein